MTTNLGLLDLTETAGCACKVDSRDLGMLRDSLNLKAEQLGLQDAGSFTLGQKKTRFAGSIDFIGPIARKPEDYGVIAALHSMSDLWTSGVNPRAALVVAIWPRDHSLWPLLIKAVEAIQQTCESVGCEVIGGHTAYGNQPFLGLGLFGEQTGASSKQLVKTGDRIWLTRGLGVGIAIGALKEGQCPPDTEEHALTAMKMQNVCGLSLNQNVHVKLVSDVTGFGLVGQLTELVKHTALKVKLDFPSVPIIEGVGKLIKAGHGASAAERNWQEYKSHLTTHATLETLRLLCDPQTNGPLLFVTDKAVEPGDPQMTAYHHIGHLVDPNDVSDDPSLRSIF